MTPAEDADDELGSLAYIAYGHAMNFTNYQGNPMPSWADLNAEQKQGWASAATAVSNMVTARIRLEITAGFVKIMDETAP